MPVRVIPPSSAGRHAQGDTDTKSRKALRNIFSLHSSPPSSDNRPASPSPKFTDSTILRSAQSTKENEKYNTVKSRRSADVPQSDNGNTSFASLGSRRKDRPHDGGASVTDISFFQQTPSPSTAPFKPIDNARSASPPDDTPPTTMTIDLNSPDRKPKQPRAMEMPLERATRRKLVRIDAQDGPWSISVAESPYDRNNYTIYTKTLTHHMTLTRSSQEILALHRKLLSAHPELSLPEAPLQIPDENAGNPLSDKKRKSSFLHTLSRFASPVPNRRDRPKDTIVAHSIASSRNSVASGAQSLASPMPTPISLPTKDSDTWDPYASPLTALDGSSATSTALASYLTTLANDRAVKQSKAWRRFIRIRTDDLISERVERAVKRVRSDIAAHIAAAKLQSKKHEMRDDASLTESAVLVDVDGETRDDEDKPQNEAGIENIKEEEEEDAATAEDASVKKDEEIEGAAQDLPGTPKPIDTTRGSLEIPGESASTPTENATIASRIPRSQSADPDKATRMSRLMQASEVTFADGDESAAEYESEAQAETEVEEGKSTTTADDDSSVSTTGRQRKLKRSKSARLKEKKAKETKKVCIDDFELCRVLGKGCAGKVLLVRHKKSENLYALKAIMKRHVLAHQELQHTLTEQAVLKRMAHESKDPFVVKLWWSFHDKENLYLIMDFHPGGDLATQLARWGRLGRDRARFYAAEIVEGVDGLHAAGVIYRDLKPENILIGSDGHIVLTDFGLSKEFPRRSSPITAPATPSGSRTDFHAQQPLPHWMKGEENNKAMWAIGQDESTTTFCGTAEYLAPEVIQGQPYSYEVDWWSFGTMLYEMLTGITPFWANNHAEMYVRVLHDELKFPDDRVLDQDTKSLIRGLLQRNPALRIKQPRIKRHPYFSMIDWSHVYYKRYIPPYIPPIDPLNASDTQNFDDTFLDMEPVIDDPNDSEENEQAGEKTNGEAGGAAAPARTRSPSVQPQEDGPDLFDGYSFKGRHSVMIDDEEDEGAEASDEEAAEASDEEEDIQRLANADVSQGIESGLEQDESEEPKTPEAKKPELPDLTPAAELAALHKAAMAAAEADDEASTPVRDTSAPRPASEMEKTPDGIIGKPAKPDVSTSSPQTPITPQATPPLASRLDAATRQPATAVMSRLAPPRGGRTRREKSGIPALDKYLSDGGDDELTERDEDDDWDFVEALPMGAEDRNGPKGTSLFARGVVDRYKLAVFRKSSTPGKGTQRRNTSGMSFTSDMTTPDAPSPSPSDKQRRAKNTGLTFRRNPKQFLKTRSPPPSAYPNGKVPTQQSSANTISSATSTSGFVSPVSSTQPSTFTGPSLKSKESTTSVGSPSSDDQSVNGDGPNPAASADVLSSGGQSPDASTRTITIDEPDKPKSKKLKKYKEGAEKMLSIFASPR